MSATLLAATAAPALAAGDRYLNLHQCVYTNGSYLYTNLLANTPNTPFNTGTNISDTRDTVAKCGPAAPGWRLDPANVSVLSLDRVRGRYLNLHQCVYSNGRFLYTNLLSNTPNTPFNTGTNLSYTPDTTPKCAPGAPGWTLDTANVAVQSLDLASGQFLNLHQCVYSNRYFLYTNLLATTPNAPFNTATHVSGSQDLAARCGPGAAGWAIDAANIAALPLDLGTP
ncbi:hypothetical protein [Actinokineospora sp. NBRC 105648]|uniref:hypothetical protein n=1 Tax=Actinokineospora sp. NBRC 105648 TaxID=3032206 RepID=UPI002555B11F|nr:hypothetical protein [Actinokineospora sp. NBRC 105648]